MKRLRKYQPCILRTVAFALVVTAAAAVVVPVSAHEVTRDKGFYIGARLTGSTLHVDDDGDQTFKIKDDGGALFLITGYSFNRVFSLELALGGAGHETTVPTIDATLGTFQFFLHYRFRPGHAFRPYVKGGLGGYGLRLEETSGASVRIEGAGVPIGIGCDYFFSNHFSLGLDLTHNIINYNTVTIDLGGGATMGFEMDEAGAMTNFGLTLTGYF